MFIYVSRRFSEFWWWCAVCTAPRLLCLAPVCLAYWHASRASTRGEMKYLRISSTLMLMLTTYDTPHSTHAYCACMLSLPQKPRPIPRAELCRWLLKTDIRLSACFSMDMQNNGFFGDLSKAGTQAPRSRPRSESGEGSPSDDDSRGPALSSSPPHGGGYNGVPGTEAGLVTPAPRICWLRQLSGTLAEPPPPGPISQQFAARVLPDVSLMMHVTQR